MTAANPPVFRGERPSALALVVGGVGLVVGARAIGLIAAAVAGGVHWPAAGPLLAAAGIGATVAAFTTGLLAHRLYTRPRLRGEAVLEMADVEGRIDRVIDDGGLEIVFQPIVELRDGEVRGVEALSRFADGRAPDVWFAEALFAGRSTSLELYAASRALAAASALPDGVYVAINVSAATALTAELIDLVRNASVPVVLELTEHTEVHDYPGLLDALRPLRESGVGLAIDDTGSGYSGLAHLVQLQPDCIKLDRSLVHGIEADPAKRALASAVADFGAEIGATVVAEGVETEGELSVVVAAGVRSAQGYLLGRPGSLARSLSARSGLQAIRVLVVDDDPTVRATVAAVLDKSGSIVVGSASDGVQAVELLTVSDPDVVVLDVEMPRMDAAQTIPRIRALAPNVAIVLLSAGTPAPDLCAAVDVVVAKTEPLTDLPDTVRAAVADRRFGGRGR